MSDKVQRYEGKDIIVYFEAPRCIHSRKCVLGLPNVFKPNIPGPWVDPAGATADEIAALVSQCPSGALHFERHDGGAQEAVPAENTVTLEPDGPLQVHADLHINGHTHSSPRATLCRCGASQAKPYCDNSHKQSGFKDSGMPAAGNTGAALDSGPLDILPLPNGPLIATGPVEIRNAEGQPINHSTKTALCRCGASQNKPYCDGSHEKIGFQAD